MILLDTHVLLWVAADPRRLSRTARAAIQRALAAGGLAVASISLWEAASLVSRGRLRIAGTVESFLEQLVGGTGVTIKEITPEIAALATQFPEDYPRDPADRLIGATARAAGLALVTQDSAVRASPLIRTIW